MSIKERLVREKEFHNEAFASNTRKSVKKYYNSASESKEFYKQLVLSSVNDKDILEYGCGPGSASFDLALKRAKVHAIDISEVAIEQTQKQADSLDLGIECLVMDAENLSFESESFDLICGSGILHHLELKRAYSEIQRVLKKNGRAVFYEPLGHNPIINMYRNLTPDMRTKDEHPLLMEDIIMAQEYFGSVKKYHFSLLSIASTFIPKSKNLLYRVDNYLLKKFKFLEKYSWIVILEFSDPK